MENFRLGILDFLIELFKELGRWLLSKLHAKRPL